ncbi:MAG: hypothetical protein PHQ27_08110, partial [Victivallales bacterium]|nr:hypothetical protein [Victivallales bacterium]
SLLLPVLAIGVPIFDVFLAIWRRSTRKLLNPDSGGIMDGDQDHLHHRLLRQTKKQTTTALTMYLIGCGFAVSVLLMVLLRGSSAPAVGYVILLIAVLIVIRQLAVVEIFTSAKLIQYGLAHPRRGIMVNIIHPFIDFGVVGFSFFVTYLLDLWHYNQLTFFIYAFVPLALIFFLSGIYKVYWLRAGLNDYWNLGMIVLLGSCASVMVMYWFQLEHLLTGAPEEVFHFVAGGVLFTMLNVNLICLERFMLNYAQGFWFRNFYLQCNGAADKKRVLVYGGGLNCRLYVNYLYCLQKHEFEEQVVGIIDDDPALHGLLVYGFKVLGSPGQIEDIYSSHPFNKIIVATPPERVDGVEKLKDFCRKHHLIIDRINISIDKIDIG